MNYIIYKYIYVKNIDSVETFQTMFRMCSDNGQNLFKLFRQCSEFQIFKEILAQKRVCSEFHDFVVYKNAECNMWPETF